MQLSTARKRGGVRSFPFDKELVMKIVVVDDERVARQMIVAASRDPLGRGSRSR